MPGPGFATQLDLRPCPKTFSTIHSSHHPRPWRILQRACGMANSRSDHRKGWGAALLSAGVAQRFSIAHSLHGRLEQIERVGKSFDHQPATSNNYSGYLRNLSGYRFGRCPVSVEVSQALKMGLPTCDACYTAHVRFCEGFLIYTYLH